MTEFERAVYDALEQVPHTPMCYQVVYADYLGDGVPHPCTCDRSQRQAERVAAAIEATAYAQRRYDGRAGSMFTSAWNREAHEAALGALGATKETT